MKNNVKFILYKQNLLDNLQEIKKFTSAKICAMIKADGYGYGMISVARILDGKVDYFGVANGVEALKLKRIGVRSKILVCGLIKECLIKDMIKHRISFACQSYACLKIISSIANKLELPAYIHIKVNSGMNRLGVKDFSELKYMIEYIKTQKNLVLEGIFTHNGFSECSDKHNLKNQHNHFSNMIKDLNLPNNVLVHFANSGAFCQGTEFHHDMVRIGKLLYGVNASYAKKNFNLKPIFALKTNVIQKQYVKCGEYIGYGENLKATKDLLIGVLPIGYGDGFISYYVGCKVIIKNKKYLILAVCMDLIIVEIDDTIKENDEVLVMGIENNNSILVTDYSGNSHNVPSQVVANLNKNRFDIVVI